MANKKLFVEPRPGGGFGAKNANGERAVVVASTQRGVINEVKSRWPDAEMHVARVRNVGPGPDKFRKA